MTPAQARSLFERILADKDIPFNYTPDCCYARCGRMAKHAAALGLTVKKCEVRRKDGDRLKPVGADGKPIKHPGPLGRNVEWTYHTAICFEVTKDGKTTKMVIDPSLFPGGPVPLDDWLARLGGKANLDVTEHDPATWWSPARARESQGDSDAESFTKHRRRQRAAIIKYINDNPGILDLPRNRVDPVTGGVLCMVNNLTERRGDPVVMASFSNRVGRLAIAIEDEEVIPWIRDHGLQQQLPVVVWYDPKRKALANIMPPDRARVLDIQKRRNFIEISTERPSPYELGFNHPGFDKFMKLIELSQHKGTDLYFVTEPGERQVQDIHLARNFDRRKRAVISLD